MGAASPPSTDPSERHPLAEQQSKAGCGADVPLPSQAETITESSQPSRWPFPQQLSASEKNKNKKINLSSSPALPPRSVFLLTLQSCEVQVQNRKTLAKKKKLGKTFLALKRASHIPSRSRDTCEEVAPNEAAPKRAFGAGAPKYFTAEAPRRRGVLDP